MGAGLLVRVSMLEKHMFVSHTKHIQWKINRSTSFAINNIFYVNFRIQEQESVPWCGEIQNQILKVLGNTFNLNSNSTNAKKCGLSINFYECVQRRIRECPTLIYKPFHTLTKLAIPIKLQYVAWSKTKREQIRL